MNPLNQAWNTLTLRNKKLNGLNLMVIILISSFIGIYSFILPSILSGSVNEGSSLENRSGSNLGYEELINVVVDKYGNLTVLGSFQGPQVTPNVNWSLPYDTIWAVIFEVVNPSTTDYLYKTEIQNLNPNIDPNDVYLHFFFLTEENMISMGMESPVFPSSTEMIEVSQTLKTDIEKAFGIENNFTVNPLASYLYPSMYKLISYGFNFSTQVDWNNFLQYFADHTPSGLADSFSTNRINNTPSWLNWMYGNNFQYLELAKSFQRSPFADYNASFECNVFLKYPQFFGLDYPSSDYQFNLSAVLDPPFTPLSGLNESAFSVSEINIVVENGNITSPSSPPYHIAGSTGINHDWWFLLNASFYDTFVNGLGSISDIAVNFETPMVNMSILSPSTIIPVQDTMLIQVQLQTNLTPNPSWGGMLIAEIYDETYFQQHLFDDFAYYNSMPLYSVATTMLMDMGGGNYMGLWPDTYRYPNGNYYLYVYTGFTELFPYTHRSMYTGMGAVYNYTPFTLNNPKGITLDVFSPSPNAVLTKNANILANITSPEPILKAEYFIYNYTQYMFSYSWGMTPEANGTLGNVGSIYNSTWDTTTVASTEDYMLRIKVTDANNTFFRDIPITVNNTLYQENIPLCAALGATTSYGYDLNIGTFDMPTIMDPMQASGGGGPAPVMFFGWGVDYGMDFQSSLYQDVIALFIGVDNPHSTNPLYEIISYNAPESDVGLTIMMPDASPKSQQTIEGIIDKVMVAFGLPSRPTLLYEQMMNMGSDEVYMAVYGVDYSTNSYVDFINKFHASVPAGLAGIYTVENMTQPEINSSIMFGWTNPDSFYGQMLYQNPAYKNYNMGECAWISPVMWFQDYFNEPVGQQWSVSLKELFPQVFPISACDPSVASAVLSGFGPNIVMPLPLGAIAMNANITSYYPYDPTMINVTPFIGFPISSELNLIKFTMLDTTLAFPYGLLTTDNIQFNFTGPYITNNILTPTSSQSVQLVETNVTIQSSQYLSSVNRTYAYLQPAGSNDWELLADPSFNGNNWTSLINSTNYVSGLYKAMTYMRDQFGNWIMNQTYFYINNSAHLTVLDVYIDDWGNVIIKGDKPNIGPPTIGYGVKLDLDIEVFNQTELNQIIICISDNRTPNSWSWYVTGQQWDVFIMMIGVPDGSQEEFDAITAPMVAAIEDALGIEGMLHYVEEIKNDPAGGSMPRSYWAMNFTQDRDWEYFLDHYETVRRGNISEVFSKTNILNADHVMLNYYILPQWILSQFSNFMGFPMNSNYGSCASASVMMQFDHIFDYTQLAQNYQFSLSDFLGITELNTIMEQSLTSHRTFLWRYYGSLP